MLEKYAAMVAQTTADNDAAKPSSILADNFNMINQPKEEPMNTLHDHLHTTLGKGVESPRSVSF